jgi:hypothetical protein
VSWIDDLRVLAFQDVTRETPTFSYFLRRVFRWYGSTFGVAPTEAEKLPLFDLLQHYFEHQYENLDEKDQHATLMELLQDPEDVRAAQLREKMADEKFFEELTKEAEKQGPLSAPAAPVNNDKIERIQPAPADLGMPPINVDFESLALADLSDIDDGISVPDQGFPNEAPVQDLPRRPKRPRSGR